MASKSNRKKRRKPRTAPPAEVEAAPTVGRPTRSEKPKSRLAAAMDRMEETVDERPPAPWGNFPLGPLSVLAGLVLIIVGLITSNPVQLAIGVGLGMLGGLELSIREHFAGFRSHTTLLAGFIFVVAVGATFYVAKLVLWQSLLIGAALAIPSFWQLRKKFEKASGGLAYKLR